MAILVLDDGGDPAAYEVIRLDDDTPEPAVFDRPIDAVRHLLEKCTDADLNGLRTDGIGKLQRARARAYVEALTGGPR